ncbi:MAG: hypothetical protein HC945_04535, partial [Nitrosarchaeum sp.]|nr:hypothetical protein [Nitrosarchaeum sp.]
NGRRLRTYAFVNAKLRTRLSDSGWEWQQALAKFPLRCFEGNPDGWRPDFDWFVRTDTVTKILEGKYDWDRNQNQTAGKPTMTMYKIPEDEP